MNQLSNISRILGSKHLINCECGFSYMPMDEITKHLCPSCQLDDILDLDDDCREFETVGVEE